MTADGTAMARASRAGSNVGSPAPVVPVHTLAAVAAAGAADAGGLPVALLGDFLGVLVDAVGSGRPIPRRRLKAYQVLGRTAAQQGVALRALLDLYLSAAWRLWPELPAVAHAAADPAGVVSAGQVMLHAVDDAVAELAEGFQLARRALVRAQESARREFFDDLLLGSADIAGVLARAAGFGMDLSGPHAVAVIRTERTLGDTAPLIATLERAVQGTKGDAQPLLGSKDGRLVVVFPAPDRAAVAHVVARLGGSLDPRPGDAGRVELRRGGSSGAWQIGVGRSGTGADGVVRSYSEARDALDLAGRLGLDGAVVDARDLLVYQVLLRDRAVLADLVTSTLSPLLGARGGPGPLLETLAAYLAAGANSSETARALHLSVRAVTYRLDRVRELTGHDPGEAGARFTLHVAVLGARLLDWPETRPA